MYPQMMMPVEQDARGYAPPSWQTASGETVNSGGFVGGLLRVAAVEAVLAEPITRFMGLEFSAFPGAAAWRANAAASPRGMRWYHKAAGFGPMPDPMPMGGAALMSRFESGQGPVLRREGWLQNKYAGVADMSRHLNEAYVGDMPEVYADWKSSGVHAPRRHKEVLEQVHGSYYGKKHIGPRGYFQKLHHLWQTSKGNVMPIARVGQRSAGYEKAVKAVASLEFKGMLSAGVSTLAVGAGVAIAVKTAMDMVGGVAIASHDRGKNSLLKSKANTLGVVQTPMSETLRMKQLQEAAMSFGALRAGIGNEAMANHRF
jgi:hypothetical protein